MNVCKHDHQKTLKEIFSVRLTIGTFGTIGWEEACKQENYSFSTMTHSTSVMPLHHCKTCIRPYQVTVFCQHTVQLNHNKGSYKSHAAHKDFQGEEMTEIK
jgi:hypothetical protein